MNCHVRWPPTSYWLFWIFGESRVQEQFVYFYFISAFIAVSLFITFLNQLNWRSCRVQHFDINQIKWYEFQNLSQFYSKKFRHTFMNLLTEFNIIFGIFHKCHFIGSAQFIMLVSWPIKNGSGSPRFWNSNRPHCSRYRKSNKLKANVQC